MAKLQNCGAQQHRAHRFHADRRSSAIYRIGAQPPKQFLLIVSASGRIARTDTHAKVQGFVDVRIPFWYDRIVK
jgi:hypothetical protein